MRFRPDNPQANDGRNLEARVHAHARPRKEASTEIETNRKDEAILPGIQAIAP